MTESEERQDEVERYVDGLMSADERAEFDRRMRDEAVLREEIELQRRVDDSLRRLFPVPVEPPAPVGSEEVVPQSRSARRWLVPALAAAACLAWGAVIWQFVGGDSDEIASVERPLDEVGAEVIQAGFRPYWICDDDRRFAATFAARLGRPLRLLPLPEDRKMLGLSYLPSISRDTVAMLGTADGHEVIVFVDRLGADRPLEQPAESTGWRWFRKQLDGLVMYELTPLSEPRFLDFLVPAEDNREANRTR
jgi:hypothetical protein